MLFRTISVQLFLGYILLLLPALFAMLFNVLALPNSGPVATMLTTAMSFHASLDYLAVCYFVVPYRRAIAKLLCRKDIQNVQGVTRSDATTIIAY